MKKIINILVIGDNETYNNQLINGLKQSKNYTDQQTKYQLTLHSITDSDQFMRKIKSSDLLDNDIVAFVDYHMGNGITGIQIIRLLKTLTNNTMIILLFPPKITEEQISFYHHDYFVMKDQFSPALCRLYLDQFIDNKIL